MSNTKRKTKQTTIYLNSETKALAVRAGEKLGLSLSSYLRMLIHKDSGTKDREVDQIAITFNEDGSRSYGINKSADELSENFGNGLGDRGLDNALFELKGHY